jgi:hypothetical protein
MDLGSVMDEVAVRLRTIQGLRVQAFPADSVTAPAAIITYPGDIVFDASYGRGMDTMDPQVVVLVGNVYKKSTRDLISAYAKGSGPKSIKATLEAVELSVTLRVTGVTFEVVTIGAVEYLAARFTIEIAGQGD